MSAERNDDDNKPSSLVGRLAGVWHTLRRPSVKYSMLSLLAVGGLGGVIAWGGFNTAMEATNTMPFCTSCHEMRDNVYKEYTSTIHFQNRTGVSAACSDCHVPKDWVHKFVRKIEASNELFQHFIGTIDTPEKFDKKRLTLANNVWASMKKTDSRECRNCHVLESMNPEFQRPRARKQHLEAMKAGNTCIDCHKGIAHKNVRNLVDEKTLEQMEAPLASYIREIPQSYIAGLARVEKREAEQAAARKAEIEAAAQVIAAEKIAASKIAAAPAQPGAAAPAQDAAKPAAAAAGGLDWSGVPAKTVTLFYPGQASFEWIQTGKDHGGARPFNKGERCSECHAKEVKDMGAKIVSGDKAEATPIPGKRAFVDVQVQAAYTAEDVYFRIQWQNTAHKPVPFVDGGKMDPANAAKLAIMFVGKEVERGEQAGCWVTCHHDGRYMPDAPKKEQLAASPAAGEIDLSQGLTKYLAETRSAIELKGDGTPRGGGDKLKGKDDLAAQFGKGTYMDLLRFRSGGDPENGHVAAQRVMSGGVAVKAEGKLDGDTWTVVMSRKLKSDKPGDISFEPGQLYTMGIALHDDYTSARFHHVSLEFRFGLDNKDAEINAVKK
ncbi:NapC/NirT family cytochrome c [Bradyrhizobium sp.]|uniref:NapC/NirT family cytochrome c n=1 Tax=Bradyrhizobium sp. TaxID=376 RepID=UPI001E16B7E9|nr:NapC/NirT family cytochrome c [Bradyrhizobium sp.]MBI5318630.1 NapC/NirT family cytochrome c [Bradyrhizobium sp.]